MARTGNGTQTRVRWKSEHVNLIVPKAAELMVKNDNLKLWEAVIQAQNLVLPPEKRRPESQLRLVSKSLFGDVVGAEMRKILEAQTNAIRPESKAAEQIRQAVEQTTQAPKPEIEVMPSVRSAIESTLDTAVDFIVEDFIAMLKPRLRQAAALCIQQVGNEVMLHDDVDAIGDVKTQTVSAAMAERGINVLQATDPGKDINVTRLKVAVLDSAERGNNIRFISQGLEEVYKFYPANNLEQAASLKGMDLIIATQFSTAPMRETAKRMNKGAHFFMVHNPKSANDQLTQYYLEKLESKQTTASNLNGAGATQH